MIKSYVNGSIFALSFLLFMDLTAAKPETTTGKQTPQEIIKVDQTDSTDIFAIPLDDSEEEDNEEWEAMQQKEKEYIEKHPAK